MRLSKAPSSYASRVGCDRRLVRDDLAAAGAVVVHRGRGGHAVQPGAQVVGVAQARIGPQGAQQRVLQDVLRVLVARQPAGVDEQLVAVGLYERPERWQHTRCNACAAGNVSYCLPPNAAARCSAAFALAVRWRLRPKKASTPSTTTISRKP